MTEHILCDAIRPVDTCKHCDAPIMWAVNEKRMRIAVEPDPTGLLILLPAAPSLGFSDPRIAQVQHDRIVRTGMTTYYRRHREGCPGRSRRRR